MPKPVDIVMLIDLQNTFAVDGLSLEEGGSLYVPGGEQAGERAAELIRHLKNSIVLLSQDFHPANHISFYTNHHGVQPFSDIYLKEKNGRYVAVAADINGEAFAVDVNGMGHIAHVRSRRADPALLKDAFRTTLWLPHGVQGTKSALFVDPVMDELPRDLTDALRRDITSQTLHAKDMRNNAFYVVRKGVRPDLHSYGISTEDDLKSKTQARVVFENIARQLEERGIREANIHIGGLATNYCVEFSHSDVYADFLPLLKKHGIDAKVDFLSDISFGIPMQKPDGVWPDLGNAPQRMMAAGTTESLTGDLIRKLMMQRQTDLIRLKPQP